MKSLHTIRPALAALLLSACTGNGADDVTYMRQRIRAYHGGETNGHRVLHLVYFHAVDTEPQARYHERIGRIMADIQAFYRTGMKRNGFGDIVFPLDMEGGKPRVHLVKGRDPAASYDYKSGDKTKREIQQALRGTLRLDRDFILVFHGLTSKRKDGSYFFHAPYYGDGLSCYRHGLCHVADCDQLDPKLLTVTDRDFRYEEHTGTFKQTLAEFNTKYLGGVAHELGHGLGLPHNGQTREQHGKLGTALMGAGNHTYRREVRGGEGSFLTLASAARLASHPLFTLSNRGETEKVTCRWSDLRFAAEGKALIVEGTVAAQPEAYAAIAYVDPDGKSDYDALTTVATVRGGEFRIEAECPRPGPCGLRLVICHVNGAVSQRRMRFTVDRRRRPNAESLAAQWLLQEIETDYFGDRKDEVARKAKQVLDRKGTPSETKRKLEHLITLTAKVQTPAPPTEFGGTEAYLSDLQSVIARVGWGQPARNYYWRDPFTRTSLFIELDDTFHPKGLYAHAPSLYAYDLDGRFKRLTATVGLQKGVREPGTAVFIVRGDGRELFRSELLKGTRTAEIDAGIEGVKRLELVVESGKQGNACCWSVWGSPKVYR